MALELHRRAELARIRRVGHSACAHVLPLRHCLADVFSRSLGARVLLDTPSDRGTLEVGDHLSVDECCLASKLFLGHVAALAEQNVDAVFVPSLMGYGRFDTFCTKFQALPDLVENAFAVANKRVRVISLRIDEPKGASEQDAIWGYTYIYSMQFGVSRKNAKRVYKAAISAQRDYDASMAREQERLIKNMAKLPEQERPLTILVAAHPYVSHDPFVGGVVEDALRELGVCVLFADETDKPRALKKSYEFSHSIPWMVNRELIGSILMLHDQVDGIVLMSAYPCGPDSMCDDAIERCIKGKPILTLTVDAQAGTAGVETRVESFVDILSYQKKGGYLNE